MKSYIISEVQSSCEMFAIGRKDHTSAIAVKIYQSKAVSHFPDVQKLIKYKLHFRMKRRNSRWRNNVIFKKPPKGLIHRVQLLGSVELNVIDIFARAGDEEGLEILVLFQR